MAQYFDRGALLIGGGIAAELQDGTVEFTNGAQEVIGLQGYLGVSKGPILGTIRWKRAVPRSGFQSGQDLHDAVLNHKFVQAQCITGGKRYTVTGVPNSISRSFGAAATSMEDDSIHGELKVTDL